MRSSFNMCPRDFADKAPSCKHERIHGKSWKHGFRQVNDARFPQFPNPGRVGGQYIELSRKKKTILDRNFKESNLRSGIEVQQFVKIAAISCWHRIIGIAKK